MPEAADSQRAWPQIPGPGAYEVNCDQRSGGVLGAGVPKFSMAAKTAILRGGQMSPGPKYSPRTTRAGVHINDPAEKESFDAPKFTFGTSRLPARHNKIPGPGQYESPSSLGEVPVYPKAPNFGFNKAKQREQCLSPEAGTRNAFLSEKHAVHTNKGVHSPGPLKYNQQDLSGIAQPSTTHPNSPRYTIRGHVCKLGASNQKDLQNRPGPGLYETPSSFGSQTHSAHPSSCSFSFSHQNRPHEQKDLGKSAYMGKEMESGNFGLHSPGPCTYETRSKRGSREPAAPAFSFGGESRWCY